jgi:predicted TIM-barrel fold metal-dependent hydrolase
VTDAELKRVDVLLDWAPDRTARDRILVDNPEKLYGF